jgi:hypothetical protein
MRCIKNNLQFTPDNDNAVMVFISRKGCPYCDNMMSEWDKFKNMKNNKNNNITIIEVDEPKGRVGELVSPFMSSHIDNAKGVPYIALSTSPLKYPKKPTEIFHSERTADNFSDFVKSTKIQKAPPVKKVAKKDVGMVKVAKKVAKKDVGVKVAKKDDGVVKDVKKVAKKVDGVVKDVKKVAKKVDGVVKDVKKVAKKDDGVVKDVVKKRKRKSKK